MGRCKPRTRLKRSLTPALSVLRAPLRPGFPTLFTTQSRPFETYFEAKFKNYLHFYLYIYKGANFPETRPRLSPPLQSIQEICLFYIIFIYSLKMILTPLFESLQKRSLSRKSFWHRHRHLLELPCGSVRLKNWPLTTEQLEVAQILAQCAPLKIEDFKTSAQKKIYRQWKRLPQDPKYFKMLVEQDLLWRKLSHTTLMDFFGSPQAKLWYRGRSRSNRKAYFEFEAAYKASRKRALLYEASIKDLLRKNPLLRYQDLKVLGVKNAQVIMEKFPQLAQYRESALKVVAKNLSTPNTSQH